MKLKAILESTQDDIEAVAKHFNIDISTADGGKTGLLTMWKLLHAARKCRAYSDEHPMFKNGHWPRILPCDGSQYCFWYQTPFNADDSHMETLLRAVKQNLTSGSRARSCVSAQQNAS